MLFRSMWEILAIGAQAIVFLVDGSDAESIEEGKYIHNHFGERLTIPELVVVTKSDMPGAKTPGEVAAIMGLAEDHVVACDPRDSSASRALLLSFYDRAEISTLEAVI